MILPHESGVLQIWVLANCTPAAGDGTIRQWQGATCVNTFRGHTDTVRGLATLPGVGFVSGSHDFTCKV
jgi:phospholipase A-2-activating protein